MDLGQAHGAFRQNGYCVVNGVLTAADVEMLGTAVDTLLGLDIVRPPGSRDIERGDDRRFIGQRHEDFPALERFVMSDRMRDLVAPFVEGPVHLFNEQFVVKGPKTGASFAWHQDSGYIGFDHKPYVTVWMAIDDATVENGCIYVMPRNLDEDSSVAPHRWDAVGKELVGHENSDEPGVALPCPAGTMVIFSSTTLHRSGANTTARPRRAYIAQYAPEAIVDPATGVQKLFAKALG